MEMAQPPPCCGPADQVEKEEEGVMHEGHSESCSGGGVEQKLDAPLSFIQPTHLLASGDTPTIAGDFGTTVEEESRGESGREQDAEVRLSPVHPAPLFVSRETTGITGDSETLNRGRAERGPRNDLSSTVSSSRPTSISVAGARDGSGSGEEYHLDASLPPSQRTQLIASEGTPIGGDSETGEGGRDKRDPRNDRSTATSSVRTIVPVGKISTGSDLETMLYGGSVGSNPRVDHSTPALPIPTNVAAVEASTGGSGSGGGSGGRGGNGNSMTLPPRGPDVEVDFLLDGLSIKPKGGAAAEAKADNHKEQQQIASLCTRIQDLETHVEIEAFKRVEAECLAHSLETERRRLADRCDTETAARENAESAAERYIGLLAEARAAWRKTQDMVQNKERELAAAEEKLTRESKGGDDIASLQRRLEDARKDKDAVRQHSASLKLALEGGGGSPSLRSPAGETAFGVAPDPPAAKAEQNVGRHRGATADHDETLAVAIFTKTERRNMEETELLPSPKAKLEGGRVAAMEARLQATVVQADAEAQWRQLSKNITSPVLVEHKAQLKHVLQQQQQHQQHQPDHAELSPHPEKATASENSHLSPSAPSYFPPSITTAALQKVRQQQEAPQKQDINPAMPLLDLDWEESSASEAENDKDGQLSFAAPSPATAPVAGVDLFPEPLLPPGLRASPATRDQRRDAGRGGESGEGDGGYDAGCGAGSDGAGSPVRLVLPPLSFSDLLGNDGEGKTAKAPQTQPHTKSPPPPACEKLEDINISDREGESDEHLGPLTQMLASSSIDGAGSGTGATWPEDCVRDKGNIDTHQGPAIAAAFTPEYPGSNGMHGGIGSGTPVNFDRIEKKAAATAMARSGGDGGCSGVEEKNHRVEGSTITDATGSSGEEKDEVVRRARALLRALENKEYRSNTSTLEVDLGSAVNIMSERKFLELHDTKRGVGELLAALDSSGLAF